MEDGQEERTIVVDQQGRLVLPFRLRERLGLKKGGIVSIRLEKSSKVVIERKSTQSLEENVKNWVSVALNAHGEVQQVKKNRRKEKETVTGKWMDSDYARRKLGVL